jgi:polar amino acid transport system substrate-binding protein
LEQNYCGVFFVNSRILRRQHVFFIALAAILSATITGHAQTATLHLASTPWSPFTGSPGKARYALELVHSALGRLGIQADTAIIQESKLTSSLLAGEFDGSAALWREEAREQALIYSRPYLQNRLILVGQHGSDVTPTTMAMLAGKRLALVEGYAYGETLKDPGGPTYVPSQGEEDSLRKVLAGSADYTLMDELVVEYLLKNYSVEARSRLVFGSTPLLVRTLHLAIRRTLPDAQNIIDRFNAELTKMIEDKSYNRLLQLDWILADADGDGIPEYVPLDDQVGPTVPDRGYRLFSDRPASDLPKPNFYLGGKLYPGWSAVPDGYKVNRPPGTFSDGTRFTIFTFRF